MWLILLFLLPAPILGAPLGAGEEYASGEELPKKKLTALLNDLNPFANADFPQVMECVHEEMTITEDIVAEVDEFFRALFPCLLKADNKNYTLLYNLLTASKMEHDFYISDDCQSALNDLDWDNDTRLDVSQPLTMADRSNICAFLDDYKDGYCELQTSCSGDRDRQQVAILLTHTYFMLQFAANGENSTDENCPAASIPFAQTINPKAFTVDFNATTDAFLDPSTCS
ncbi:hypothetical protein M3Y99_00112800 [Aphelenchoides fujianensis]|nr:hypothetical protein M3Y99_00112800 [Aphelenchoides fujianensis]